VISLKNLPKKSDRLLFLMHDFIIKFLFIMDQSELTLCQNW